MVRPSYRLTLVVVASTLQTTMEETINIRISRKIKKRLQIYACDRKVPLRLLLDKILEDWLNEQEILVIAPERSLKSV